MKKSFCWTVFLAGVAGPVVSFAGRWYWFFDIFTHFRVQLSVFLFFTLLILLFGRQFKKAAVLGVVLLFCFISLFPYLSFSRRDNFLRVPEKELRILLANVCTSNRRYDMLINLVKTKMPDIVILEEIDQSWYNELEKSLTDYKVYKAVPRDDNFGIAVFSKIPMAIKVKYIGSAGVPSLECLIEEDDDEIILWATHPVPPISDEYWHLRNEQLRELSALISGSDCQVVVAGDFNTSPWSRCFNGLKAAKLDDTAAGIGVQASWPAMWPAFMRIPIDHVLISKEIKVIERCVLEDIGSDHLPVFVRLQLK